MQLKSKVSLRQLDYFKAIGDAGSFRGAAERLGVTQPTLTAQIAALEESVGVKLFERTRSGATLTVAARELVPVCNRIQEEVQSFVDTAHGFSGGVAGTYRIGVTPTLAPIYYRKFYLKFTHGFRSSDSLCVRAFLPS